MTFRWCIPKARFVVTIQPSARGLLLLLVGLANAVPRLSLAGTSVMPKGFEKVRFGMSEAELIKVRPKARSSRLDTDRRPPPAEPGPIEICYEKLPDNPHFQGVQYFMADDELSGVA